MIDYFFRRQPLALIAELEDTRVYNAQIALLNHIRANYTETIPTIDLLLSKIEDEAAKRSRQLPALYALYTASDIYKAKDHSHEFPLVVLCDSKIMDRPTHYSDAVGLAARLTDWLLAHNQYHNEDGDRCYQLVSPIHIEPYQVTDKYTIMLLFVKVNDRVV